MSRYDDVQKSLLENPQKWLITGVAGFIGSNLLEKLLCLKQSVVGIDNFSTGHRHNLSDVERCVEGDDWKRFQFIHGDITDLADCQEAVSGVDHVLHQAALGSVPRSVVDPIASNAANVSGFLNMLVASKDAKVKSFTYAASSSTYGDHPDLPKVEEKIGKPLSPYAVTKYVNELYANVFSSTYGFKSIGLRYFNVFGPRQDPNGAYAAVIPKWIASLANDEEIIVNGDGETSRDFCYIDNTVQANILAALSADEAKDKVYNIAVGDRTSLNELFNLLACEVAKKRPSFNPQMSHGEFRRGDVRHSQADISKATKYLGFAPLIRVPDGIGKTTEWFLSRT